VGENGQVIELTDDGIKLDGRVPAGDVFVDGSGVGDVTKEIMHEREELALDGIVVVSVNIDRFTAEVLGEPEIISRGFMCAIENVELNARIKKKVVETIKRVGTKDRLEIEQVVKNFIYTDTRRRPVVLVNLGKA
jgi:ribonuclease J